MDKLIKTLVMMGSIAAGIGLLLFVTASTWIGQEMADRCQQARDRYDKADCVEALSLYLDDKNNDYGSRNSAIWALGQLGDSRALPMLEKYYTGDIPKREPWKKMISQYELKKAIKLAQGGINITAIFWRERVK